MNKVSKMHLIAFVGVIICKQVNAQEESPLNYYLRAAHRGETNPPMQITLPQAIKYGAMIGFGTGALEPWANRLFEGEFWSPTKSLKHVLIENALVFPLLTAITAATMWKFSKTCREV